MAPNVHRDIGFSVRVHEANEPSDEMITVMGVSPMLTIATLFGTMENRKVPLDRRSFRRSVSPRDGQVTDAA